jgi:hypothetical protein
MINPNKITNYNLNKYQLEEHAIFWLLVAGKTAKHTSKSLDNMLQEIDPNRPYKPFEAIRNHLKPFEAILSPNH